MWVSVDSVDHSTQYFKHMRHYKELGCEVMKTKNKQQKRFASLLLIAD